MSVADSLHIDFGALELPIPVSTAPTLTDLDPARDILADLLKAALNAELGQRWPHAAPTGESMGAVPVADVLPTLDLLDTMRERKASFPLLSVARAGDVQSDELTLERAQITQSWQIDYVLCPLTTGAERRVLDVLQAALKIIVGTIERGGHRAYRVGPDGRPLSVLGPWGDGCCGFLTAAVTRAQMGGASFSASSPAYLAASVTLTTTEATYDHPDADTVPLTGATLLAGTGDASGVIEGLIEARL